jgi:HK97 family phage prohead protease
MSERRHIRTVTFAPHVRAAVGGETTLRGMFVRYGEYSEFLFKSFYERMLPGVFDQSLASGRDVIATVNHDSTLILGRLSSGTLRIEPGPDGLSVAVSAPDTSYARDLAASILRGDVKGMSFIFDDVDVEWSTYQGERCRDVRKAILHEVSFVALPCYTATTATAGTSHAEAPAAERSADLDLMRRRVRLAEVEDTLWSD